MKNFKDILLEIKGSTFKLFPLLYIYVLVIGVAIGLYYIANINDVQRSKVPPRLADTNVVNDIKIVEAKIIPPVDVIKMKNASNEMINAGRELYLKTCASCHGETGLGDGQGATGLNPPPRNFTKLDGWKNNSKLTGIYQTLETGIPGTAMIAYDYLTPDEKFSLSHYIRTFVPNPPQDTDTDLQTLDQTYSISKGKAVPAQIPVAKATELIIKEKGIKAQQITNVLNTFEASKSQPGGKVFSRIAKDKELAINWIYSTNSLTDEQLFRSNLVKFINQNGFNNKVFYLSSKEWSDLYNYLKSIIV